MEPLAVAALASIAGAAVLAVIIGAMSGAVAWRVRHGLVWGVLSSIGVYLLLLAIDRGLHSLRGGAVFGGPPLVLTFLISYLVACHLKTRANLRSLWASLAALASALVIGYLYLLWFRFGLLRSSPWEPIWITVGADTYLLFVTIRGRNLVLD